ncbi:hypothetical protein FVE85_9111 [Porphyridium purpureum]|uniref:Histone deacetylase complex subunit SAP30 Sin3 binding domain-containing protein n=1 Tax=Porphyridium purpureum TaxID=35688 RepID=A0A5J4YN18_PORPP|nr:hypothetical protein FVE85_9111 [Porphyridium purpureum]|eukprot:POR6964..scf222_8
MAVPDAARGVAPTCIDLSRLRKSSLKRYKRHFKISMSVSNPSKAELVAAVSSHFAEMRVLEHEVFDELARFFAAEHQKLQSATLIPELAQRQGFEHYLHQGHFIAAEMNVLPLKHANRPPVRPNPVAILRESAV